MLHARLLLYFDEVSRCGSIRKAALKLDVAPSAISRQIQAFEQELGTELFRRSNRRLTLTAAGEILIRHIRQTLADYDRATAQIAEIRGLRRGEVRVLMMAGLAGSLVPAAASRFRRLHPGVQIRLQVLPTGDDIIAALSRNEADLGLGFDFPRKPGLRIVEQVPGTLGAVMAPGHPLALHGQLRLSQCLDFPLVVADATMAIRPHLDALFLRLRAGHPAEDGGPRFAAETNSIETMRRLAMEEGDDAITFLTPFDIEQDVQRGALTWRPVHELARHSQHLMLIAPEAATANALTALFIETLRDGLGQRPRPGAS